MLPFSLSNMFVSKFLFFEGLSQFTTATMASQLFNPILGYSP